MLKRIERKIAMNNYESRQKNYNKTLIQNILPRTKLFNLLNKEKWLQKRISNIYGSIRQFKEKAWYKAVKV